MPVTHVHHTLGALERSPDLKPRSLNEIGIMVSNTNHLCTIFITSESIKEDLNRLTHEQLKQVSEFIAFLKFRNRSTPIVPKSSRHNLKLDPSQLRLLATEFAEDDRELAESGISEYKNLLTKEDQG